MEQAEIAYKLDPLSFVTANSYFTALVENFKFDEAENLMKTIEKRSDSNNKFVIDRAFFRLYTAKKDYASAIPHLEKLANEEYAFYRFLGFSYGKVGDTVNAYKLIGKVRKLDIDDKDGKNHIIAMTYAGLKETDSVFYYLDTTRNKRSNLFYRERTAFFGFIKNDPRYPELLKSHGFDNN